MLAKQIDRDFEVSRHLLNVGVCLAISLAFVLFLSAMSAIAFFALWQRNHEGENHYLSLIIKLNNEEIFTSAASRLSETSMSGENVSETHDKRVSRQLMSLLSESDLDQVQHISDAPNTSIFEVIRWGDLPADADRIKLFDLASRFISLDSAYWHTGKNKGQTFFIAVNGNFAAFSQDVYVPRSAETLRAEVEIILEKINRAATGISLPVTRPAWTEKYVHPLTGEQTLTSFSPIYDGQGRIVIYVGSNVKPGDLLSDGDAVKLASGEGVQLVTQTGTLLASAGQAEFGTIQKKSLFRLAVFGDSTISVNPKDATVSFERPLQVSNWHFIYLINLRTLLHSYTVHFWLCALLFFALTFTIFFVSQLIRVRVVAPARRRAVALDESEKFIRGILSIAPVGFAVIDPTVPKLLISNRIYDHGIDLIKSFGAENLANLNKSLSNSSPEHVSIQLIQETFSNNFQRFYSVRAARGHLHNSVALIFAVSDISEEKRIEVAQLASRSAIESESKAKEAFLAMVSHELRAPLHGVLASLELLTATSLRDSHHYLLDVMESSTRNLLELTNDLLDFSKIEASKFTLSKRDTYLIPELEAVGIAFATRARLQGITFDWMLDPELRRAVITDPVRLAQIVTNLVSNAIKFTPAGYVAVTVKLEQPSGSECQLVLIVRDSGIGIAATEMAYLFQPFSQVSNHEVETSGSGLGLSIIRKLLVLFDGEICVDSEKGLGSSVTVRLRMRWAEDALPQEKSRGFFAYYTRVDRRQWYLESLILRAGFTPVPASQYAVDGTEHSGVIAFSDEMPETSSMSRSLRIVSNALGPETTPVQLPEAFICAFDQAKIIDAICGQNVFGNSSLKVNTNSYVSLFVIYVLVIDDHVINSTILARQLETLGCTVDVYNDPEEALAAFDPNSHQLIITDMNMLKVSGERLARRVREIAGDVPIIAATADVTLKFSANPELFSSVLVKPFTTIQLGAAIDSLIGSGILKAATGLVKAGVSDHAQRLLSESLLWRMERLTDADLARCSMAIQALDNQELFDLAHRMRGAFLVVGMPNLVVLCSRLESAALFSNLEDASALLVKINQEWVATRSANGRAG